MPEFKIIHGFLALVDIVDFTRQSIKMGDTNSASYIEYFKEKITTIATKCQYNVVKSLGDAMLLFGQEPAGIIAIMKDLYRDDKPDSRYGFDARFRMVAHTGYFQLEMQEGKPKDLISAEGIKVFRLEKLASAGEMVITRELLQVFKTFSLLDKNHIDTKRLIRDKSLKGFDNEEWHPPFYSLRLMNVTTQSGSKNLLIVRMQELERDVQEITVFGNIYPPVPMEKNFINLNLLCSSQRVPSKESGIGYAQEDREIHEEYLWDLEEQAKYRGRGRNDRWILDWSTAGKSSSNLIQVDVNKLYAQYPKGIIFGLPGAGKTTLLRHLAYKEFKSAQITPGNTPPVVLFIYCRNIPFYDDWYKQRFGEDSPVINIEMALEFMIWVFLFGKKEAADLLSGQLVEYQEACKQVKQAFEEKRLTLLVDALDEAPDNQHRVRIKQLFFTAAAAPGNRVYLTSRPTGWDEYPMLKTTDIQQFNVRSLDMEQVRDVARNLLKEDSSIFRAFDEAIWQEEVVVRMAATPMTTLLITAYFQVYGRFDLRFSMYDLMVKYILYNVWDKIKTGSFHYENFEAFFQEVKKPGFLEQNKEIRIFYDALAGLCFHLFYDGKDGKVQRSVHEKTLLCYFSTFLENNFYYQEKEESIRMTEQWFQQLKNDHLLIPIGPTEYQFVHSTVMEYLAAYYLVTEEKKAKGKFRKLVHKCIQIDKFLDLETIPIAVGSDIVIGFEILRILKDIKPSFSNQWLKEFGLRCLAELEWLIEKDQREIQILSLKIPGDNLIRQRRNSIDWIYRYAREQIIGSDKEQLCSRIQKTEQMVRLSRSTLMTEYLDFKNDIYTDDAELQELRKQMLFTLAQKGPAEEWWRNNSYLSKVQLSPGEMAASIDNVLKLDSIGYHPEDKNFRYYQQIIGKELKGFFGSPNFKHSGVVRDCSLLPDSKKVISASFDRTLKLWDLETGKEIRSFIGHKNSIQSCTVSLVENQYMISASRDQTLKLWDLETGKEIRTFSGHKDFVIGCIITPDGKQMISASGDKTIKLWDMETGKEIRSFIGHLDIILNCILLPDCRRIVSASWDHTLKLWDLESGQEIRTFKGHKDLVWRCAVSPNGQYMVSASSDQTLKLWNIETGDEIRTFYGHQSTVYGCSLSPDGKYIISASRDQTMKLWELDNGREIRTFTGHHGWPNQCYIFPDRKWIVSAFTDSTLKLWDLESGKEIHPYNGHQGAVYMCAVSSNGLWMLSASEDKTLKLWNIETGKEIRSFIGHQEAVTCCVVLSDNRRMVSASLDKTLKLWDLETGKEFRSFIGHQGIVLNCAVSPENLRIVSASEDQSVKLWDLESGREIRSFSGHHDAVMDCAILPDGLRMISASRDKTLKLWNMKTGREIRTFTGHNDHIISCTISPDGKLILSASKDHTMKLWNLETGQVIHTFTGHDDTVWKCALTPDGQKIVSVSNDYTMKIWELNTGKILESIRLLWIPRFVTISPIKPSLVYTANLNGTITIFKPDQLCNPGNPGNMEI